MKKYINSKVVISLALLALLLGAATAEAKVTKATLYYDGELVRTIANPAAIPHEGIDTLYSITNGVEEQVSVTTVAPGDGDYHGGRWAVYTVTFNDGVLPYLLTSEDEVLAAETAGDITIERAPEMDNRCPVLP